MNFVLRNCESVVLAATYPELVKGFVGVSLLLKTRKYIIHLIKKGSIFHTLKWIFTYIKKKIEVFNSLKPISAMI